MVVIVDGKNIISTYAGSERAVMEQCRANVTPACERRLGLRVELWRFRNLQQGIADSFYSDCRQLLIVLVAAICLLLSSHTLRCYSTATGRMKANATRYSEAFGGQLELRLKGSNAFAPFPPSLTRWGSAVRASGKVGFTRLLRHLGDEFIVGEGRSGRKGLCVTAVLSLLGSKRIDSQEHR